MFRKKGKVRKNGFAPKPPQTNRNGSCFVKPFSFLFLLSVCFGGRGGFQCVVCCSPLQMVSLQFRVVVFAGDSVLFVMFLVVSSIHLFVVHCFYVDDSFLLSRGGGWRRGFGPRQHQQPCFKILLCYFSCLNFSFN